MDGHAQTTVTVPVGNGTFEVGQGDCIYSIAARTGHDWQTLWDHPENRQLREARREPGILLPGDRVFLPRLSVKTLELESGKRHRIVVDVQLVWLRLRMCDSDGEPIASASYTLHVGVETIPCTTDSDGRLEVRVPALASEATLVHRMTGEAFTLRIGHMDPPGSAAAVRKRLANLGYHPGGEEVEMTPELDEMAYTLLDDFRDDAGLPAGSGWEAVLRQLERNQPWTA
jgi:hypothetical protein